MFTLQASALRAKLMASANSGDWGSFVDELVTTLGKCSQPVEHRGPATFGGDDPPNAVYPDSIINNEITQGWAINLTEGSHANFLGDVINQHNTVYNVGGDSNYYETTENHYNDTINYNNTVNNWTNVTWNFTEININGETYCWEELSVLEDISPNTDTLTVVTAVSFDEETCELTVDDQEITFVTDIGETTVTISVPTECPEEEP